MPTVIAIAALTLFLFAFQHTLRRCGPWVLWIGFGVLPAALTGYWIAVNLFDAFLWFKLYSVLFCV